MNGSIVAVQLGDAWVAVGEVAARAQRKTMASPHSVENACIPAKLHVELYEPMREPEPPLRTSQRLTIVLCHGFGGSARNFRPQSRALAATTVRFVLYDARGHARSDKPTPEHAYDFECLVGDLASVVEAHATGRVIVGGISLGAAVALGYALRRQDRVAGLLLSAYPDATPGMREWATQFAESIDKYGVGEAGERFIWGTSSRFDPKTRELVRMGFVEHAPWALAALLRRSLGRLRAVEAMAEELRKLHVPTRVVVGGADSGSLEPCRLISSLIPGATLSVFEGAGHIVNLACPTDFNEELRTLMVQATE